MLPLAGIATAVPAAGADGPVVTVLEALPVSGAQAHAQQSPLVARDGAVYVANIEPGPRGDVDGLDLLTVVRRGTPGPGDADGWTWTATTIDGRTAHDPWHSAPAIGMDERGRVHVAWNMHNLPWQYGVSTRPHDIAEFEFRGQAIDDAALRRYKFENRTNFPAPGSAAIPGNQITYPAFFNDREGRLWVTYRFAARPARAFERRAMSSGVARHDARTGAWRAIGGELELAPGDFDGPAEDAERLRALASEDGWTSYAPRLSFGPGGRVNANFLWREGIAGPELTRPCLLVSDDGAAFRTVDGAPVALPATSEGCGAMDDGRTEYYSITDAESDAAGEPHVVLSPVEGGRLLFSHEGDAWSAEPTPWAASEIFFDADDNLWAAATGPHLFVRPAGEPDWIDAWRPAEADATGCRPRAALDEARRVAYVYTMDCELDLVSVRRVDLDALLAGAR